ncbi:MAG: response regulator [Crocinitomicaceae bacterium]|nr:response regulator [Crocinitomicaceae bacterium]|tara:strand:- start:1403 stop:1810 length:408 start_codon:yes stop_codon:yes gene_type:complete
MNKTTFYLVDDDDVYLFITKKILKMISPDITIREFTDGEEALDFFKENAFDDNIIPDVILLDLNMPYLDGWGFLNEMNKLHPDLARKTKIYIVTSSDNEEDLSSAENFKELAGYFVKPIERERLQELCESILSDK